MTSYRSSFCTSLYICKELMRSAKIWLILPIVLWLALLLTGCWSNKDNLVSAGSFSFQVPSTYQSVSNTNLDRAEIDRSVIGVWKWDKGNIILASSKMPQQMTIKEFAEKTSLRLSQEMVGYTNKKISQKKFSCGGSKTAWYLHHFEKADLQNTKDILTYYDQFYFVNNNTLYILSVAQMEKKNIVNDMIRSLTCTTLQ